MIKWQKIVEGKKPFANIPVPSPAAVPEQLRASLQVAQNHFWVRYDFLKQISLHAHEASLQAAIAADGGKLDGLFVDPEGLYKTLNKPGSKTRDWLILNGISK